MSTSQPNEPPDRRPAPFDAALRAALSDITPPPGLRERVLAQLDDVAAIPSIASGWRHTATRRQQWLVGAGSLLAACLAGVLVSWLLWPQLDQPLTADAVMMEAQQVLHGLHESDEALADNRPPARYPLGLYVPASVAVAWQRLPPGFLQRPGVAYRLIGPAQEQATLLVVDLQGPRGSPALATLPRTPAQSVHSSGGSTTSVWTDGTRLYVLIVAGDARQFQQFVRQPGAVA